MMNCEEAAKLLHPYLDKELSKDEVEKLEEHLKNCKGCIGHFEYDKALKRILKSKSAREQISPEAKSLIEERLKDLK